jgi:hypothetical protein
MRLSVRLVAALGITACSWGNPPAVSEVPAQSTLLTQTRPQRLQWEINGLARAACPQVPGMPTCLALVESKSDPSPSVTGWKPADIQRRYHLPSSTNGAGQIVAVVDAYNNPHVASDLAAYRSKFALGTADFHKYNQRGERRDYPAGNTGWGLEIDLDVEMVSAACPKCTIYLIEANRADSRDLQTAEAQAVTLGAHIVSNGWICYGSVNCVNPKYFDTAGVVYLAASGDIGYNENGAPEALSSVVSVGGTLLAKNGPTYSERVFDGSGAGCARGVTKPVWQTDPHCAYRTDSDVSAVAWDIAEYDTYGYDGWFRVGGTSAAASLTAGVFGLAGNATDRDAARKFWHEERHRLKSQLNYISSGSDGSCGGKYLCQAGTHEFGTYSGPAGWGTPNGVKAY